MKFSALSEVARNKSVEAGCPVLLHCDVPEPTTQVYVQKAGELILPQGEYENPTKEKLRELSIKSPEVRHSGACSCEAADHNIDFKVDVAGDLRILSFVSFNYIFQLMLS